ncbi:MAG: hypothetical protein Q4B48_07965, partial [Syntrophomonadaceae bacterium]|nr:hypothetical protein [Syntrophomonadaceae bacterium]
MPLKTSSFSKALFINNIKRFWPVLFGYCLAVVFALSSQLVNLSYRSFDYAYSFGQMLFSLAPFWAFIMPLAIITVAGGVWSYMFRPQSTAMINALPLNRKCVFYTNYISGLFILLAPVVLGAVIYLIGGMALGFTGLPALGQWLLIIVSVTVLLFSLASALAMTTGNLPTLVVLFAVSNCLLIFLEFTVRNFLNTYLYGIMFSWSSSEMLFSVATPLYWLADASNDIQNGYAAHTLSFVIYLLVGLALMVAACKLYQRRHMERAGDVIAIRPLYPVFIYGVALCASLSFGNLLAEILFSPSVHGGMSDFVFHLACFIFTGALGYFAALMLLNKSFRVFKQYKGLLVYSLILVLAGVSVYYDFYGYATYAPDPDKVVAAGITTGNGDYSAMLHSLEAEPSRNLNLRALPGLPTELALRIGSPLPEKAGNQGVGIYYDYSPYYGYSGEYQVRYSDNGQQHVYPAQRYSLLTADELQWLWENRRDIYATDAGLDAVADVHEYLVANIGTLRRDARHYGSYGAHDDMIWDNIYIAWRLDNGKVVMRQYPVVISAADYAKGTSELAHRLDALMGGDENRAKLLAYTRIPATELTEKITINLGGLYYRLYDAN